VSESPNPISVQMLFGELNAIRMRVSNSEFG